MFLPVNGSCVRGGVTEATGTTGAGGLVAEIGGGTASVVVVVGGGAVVVVGGGVVVVVGGGAVVVVVHPQGPVGADDVGEDVALHAAPPNVTLKAIITIADPMATMVRFTTVPSSCLVGHRVAPLMEGRPHLDRPWLGNSGLPGVPPSSHPCPSGTGGPLTPVPDGSGSSDVRTVDVLLS